MIRITLIDVGGPWLEMSLTVQALLFVVTAIVCCLGVHGAMIAKEIGAELRWAEDAADDCRDALERIVNHLYHDEVREARHECERTLERYE